MTRYERIWANAVRDAAFYRKNPHLFARDYLHLDLRMFQRILIIMMNYCAIFIFIASRGIGKSFLSAVFCVIRCILWPGTKIVIASGQRGQAINVLEKVQTELILWSPELNLEIDWKQTKINGTNAIIMFKNGSFMKVVTASDGARYARANLLLIDEFRLVKKEVINMVLRKFLTQKRMPRYEELSKEDRLKEYKKEKNKTIYLSSAFFGDHWSYQKCIDTFKSMFDIRRNNFICGFPYQLGLKEGVIDEDAIINEMLEEDYNEVTFDMEYSGKFYVGQNDAFFDFNSIAKTRKIKYPVLPNDVSAKLKSDPLVRIQPKQPGERRLISVDIALMASTRHKNDATAIHITQLVPTKAGRYTVNMIYTDTNEGMRTEEEALEIRKLFDEYDCDYLVLDAKGIGLPVYDAISKDISDPETGEIYPALSCYNNQDLADRCTVRGAPKAVWAVLGNPKFNSDCALLLREAIRSGRIRLLANEYDGREAMEEIPAFNKLSDDDKLTVMMPYVNTTLLVNELVNLQHEETNGVVRIFEKSGMRKDRYSSLAYNYYVANQLEKELRKRDVCTLSEVDTTFTIRVPKIRGGGR